MTAGKPCDVNLEAVAQAIANGLHEMYGGKIGYCHHETIDGVRYERCVSDARSLAAAAVAVRDGQWRARLTERADAWDRVGRAYTVGAELRRLVAESEADDA